MVPDLRAIRHGALGQCLLPLLCRVAVLLRSGMIYAYGGGAGTGRAVCLGRADSRGASWAAMACGFLYGWP